MILSVSAMPGKVHEQFAQAHGSWSNVNSGPKTVPLRSGRDPGLYLDQVGSGHAGHRVADPGPRKLPDRKCVGGQLHIEDPVRVVPEPRPEQLRRCVIFHESPNAVSRARSFDAAGL